MKNRYNPFTQIHKGLRALLYDTAMAIQHNDFSNVRSSALVVDQVQKVLWLFEGHANIEDTMVFPIIEKYAPEVVQDFEAQHVKDHALGATVQQVLDELAQCENNAERVHIGTRLQRSFESFIAFNLDHMVQEETIVAGIIWQHYTDEQIHELTGEIVRSIPADKNTHYTDWMLLGNNDIEVIQWLTSVRTAAPEFVYAALCERAQQLLQAERWSNIHSGLVKFSPSLN